MVSNTHPTARFANVEQFLSFIGRAEIRKHGLSSGQMGNWAHREGRVPSRHLPLFTRLCAARGVECPLHLFSVQMPADPTVAGAVP